MAIEGQDATKQPWQTPVTRLGTAGLQLNKALDALDPTELSRMLNLTHTGDQRLTSRFGQTPYATSTGTDVHTIGRLNDPQGGNDTHFWGIDTKLYNGLSGGLNPVDSGYSGAPLSLLPWRPNLSSASWMIAADANKMRISAAGGPVLPLGIAAPAAAANATALLPLPQNFICQFNSNDGSQAANWSVGSGQDRSSPPILLPNNGAVVDIPANLGPNGINAAISFNTSNGPLLAKTGYSSFFGHSINPAIDLTQIGAVPASDNDIIHLWFETNGLSQLEEFRIYLVCSNGFNPTALPGASPTDNTDAFVRSFPQAALQSYLGQRVGAVAATADLAAQTAQQQFLNQQTAQLGQTGHGQRIINAQNNDTSTASIAHSGPVPPGASWNEMGIVGIPIRRADFVRIGNTANRGWNTITGIIIHIQTIDTTVIQIGLQGLFLTGGYGPDTADPAAEPYDYRYTIYDPRTGFESNPSPIMSGPVDAATQSPDNRVNALRQQVTLNPGSPSPDGAQLERWYRRGGTLPTDWFFLGTSGGHGATFTDTFSDAQIETAGTLAINHDQPVTTVDANGNTIKNQALNALWGPTDGGYVFGCGDPHRPGFLYWPIPGQAGHWPATNNLEVCSPSEQLIIGAVWGGQAYVFSKERLYVIYPNFDGSGNVRTNSTACAHGLVVKTGLATTPLGLAFVARDAIRLTTGTGSISLSDNIRQLFHGVAVNGYNPIDFNHPNDIKLSYHDEELWFIYRDSGGTMQCLVYHLFYKFWRPYGFAQVPSCLFSDTSPQLRSIIGSKTNGQAYIHTSAIVSELSYTDAGNAGIAWQARTGAYDGGQLRNEKHFGDVILDADLQGTTLTAQTFLNTETITNTAQTIVGSVGRRRYLFDAFGTGPQKGRNVSLDLSGTAPANAQVKIDFAGVSVIAQPDIMINRPTNWDQLTGSHEKFVIGVEIEADTLGNAIPLIVEYDNQDPLGVSSDTVQQASSFTLTTNGRHKRRFTWPSVKADLIRIRAAGMCSAWELYRLDWISEDEPARIAGWDTNWINLQDQYLTGINLECDTFGQNKTVQLLVDQVVVQTFTVNTNGRRNLALTVNAALPSPGPVRGRVFRLRATDANLGLLYGWKFVTEPEPGLQTNWNQNFTIAGTMGDKWLKGFLIEADTFGLNKTLQLEVDGQVVVGGTWPLTVLHAGRTVQMYAFPQVLGRIFRLYPTDGNPGRLYNLQWVFDEEPLAFTRWETQETDHLIHGWQSLLWQNVTYKSPDGNAVTLTLTIYGNGGTVIATQTYTLPGTAGLKQKQWMPFQANKGVLFKYVYTCAVPFWLYREETNVFVKPWMDETPLLKRPFGSDDLDTPHRAMGKSSLSAAHEAGRPGTATTSSE